VGGVHVIDEALASGGVALKPFDVRLGEGALYPLRATSVDTLQINMGRLCNLSCRHCHVEAGPARTEVMGADTVADCLEAIGRASIGVVDITGGAPEMNPGYRRLVEDSASAGARVLTRTNLVAMLEDGRADLPAFLAEHRVEVVASLPHYSASTTDRMRGEGTFDRSIEVLRRLNAAGYGVEGSGLALSLVYNPAGAYMPGAQRAVEADFSRALARDFGVTFSHLYTITNMPVGRFLDFLRRSGNLRGYLERLVSSFNPAAAEQAMCRTMVSVGWDGALYDCDFNQMLGLGCAYGSPAHIREFDRGSLSHRRIVTGPHCYGCTAGAGSSCTGEVA
jgi:radical SAM/Cys-rich protein